MFETISFEGFDFKGSESLFLYPLDKYLINIVFDFSHSRLEL